MSEWKERELDELGRIVTGKTPPTKNQENYGGEIPFICIPDLGRARFIGKTKKTISKLGLSSVRNCVLPEKSVIVSCIATIGQVGITRQPISVTNQQINSIIPDAQLLNSEFCYYYFKNLGEDLSLYGGGGSIFEIISKQKFSKIKLLLPPLPEQKAIAAVLSSLDDKIDLLHRQNETLEKMAETLFRKWFVEDADESWEVMPLGFYVDTYNGVSYISDFLNPSKTAMVTLKSFNRNGGFRLDGFKEYTGLFKEQHLIKEGDLLVAHTDITQDAAVIGNPILVVNDPQYDRLIFSMDLVKVTSKSNLLSIEFLYYLLKSSDFKEHALGYANGSTVLHLSKKSIPEYEFKVPNIGIIEKFTNIAHPIIKKQFENHKQIRTLTQLRDTLLPKLMSGEVRVKA